MNRKNKYTTLVYSTNRALNESSVEKTAIATLPPEKQDLRVWLDKKSRKGKVVTLVKGFVGSEDDLKELAKTLKIKCGVGGSQKDGEIMIQGNFKDKIVEILTNAGYKAKSAGG